MGGCLFYVALALLEFAIVDVIWRMGKGFVKHSAIEKKGTRNDEKFRLFEFPLKRFSKEHEVEACKRDTENERECMAEMYQHRAKQIDKISRVLFPLSFLGFSVVFFAVCLGWN